MGRCGMGGNMRIVVIEDDDINRQMVREMLEMGLYEVYEANDCQDGLAFLQNLGHADIVLIDWKTPRMSGIDLVKELRKDPRFIATKLIMMTGLNELSNVQMALECGADEYLMKPFTREMMFEKLQMVGCELS